MAIYLSKDWHMEEKEKHLVVDDTEYETEVPEVYAGRGKKEAVDPKNIQAVIPGVIVDIKTRKGQKVTAGDVVIVLEAMKMYNDIEAESDGEVAEIFVSKGDRVAKGQLMIRLA